MLPNFFSHFRVAASPPQKPEQAGEAGANLLHKISSLSQNKVDSRRDARPMLGFGRELSPASRGQFVIARLAIVFGSAPLSFDPPLRLQPIERGIKRALLDPQNLLRHLLIRSAIPRS